MFKEHAFSDFELFLRREGLSHLTIQSYISSVESFILRFGPDITFTSLLSYKGYLTNRYKPTTVNQRIQAINRYLAFIARPDLSLTFVRIQEKPFLENVISDADYRFLKRRLFEDHDTDLAMAVWFLAATGARVSELLQFKVEHLAAGYIDLSTKGGKVRRIHIPTHLTDQAKAWIAHKGLTSGYIFLNQHNRRITARGLASKLQQAARKYHLNEKEVHPHSFRHRFAKNFLEKYQDIALLADLMGHDSIETTRIYLRRTSTEQRQLFNSIVDW